VGWRSKQVLVVLGVAWAAGLAPRGVPAASFASGDPALDALWEQGLELEKREALLESSVRYEAIAAAVPDSAFIRWRIARNYWRHGERLPVQDKKGRLRWFRAAERWADESLELDPECGECVLWKLASIGRVATTGNVIQAASRASAIAELIERGIELEPGHADNPQNVTLANLYYAGSAFYRVVPDWFWLSMVIGVRGDNARALEYIDKAIEISPGRLDYQVERGAVLLCMGTDGSDPERIEEGRRVMRHAVDLDNFQTTDAYDRAHARIMLEEPERACGYSRDGWIEFSESVQARWQGGQAGRRAGAR
jgi:tetratricopeptide (TPR) repeat protein